MRMEQLVLSVFFHLALLLSGNDQTYRLLQPSLRSDKLLLEQVDPYRLITRSERQFFLHPLHD